MAKLCSTRRSCTSVLGRSWQRNRRTALRKKLWWACSSTADFSKVINLDAKNPKAWNNRGAVYCDLLGQYDKAIEDFSQAIVLDQNFAFAWANRGIAYRYLG